MAVVVLAVVAFAVVLGAGAVVLAVVALAVVALAASFLTGAALVAVLGASLVAGFFSAGLAVVAACWVDFLVALVFESSAAALSEATTDLPMTSDKNKTNTINKQ